MASAFLASYLLSHQAGINKSDLLNLNIPLTTLKEQKRITSNILSTDENALKNCLSKLKRAGELNILSQGSIKIDSTLFEYLYPSSRFMHDFFHSLTEKQRNAFELASRNGFYNNPKNATLDSLASEIGVSRATYREHLRTAEYKMVSRLMSAIREEAAFRVLDLS